MRHKHITNLCIVKAIFHTKSESGKKEEVESKSSVWGLEKLFNGKYLLADWRLYLLWNKRNWNQSYILRHLCPLNLPDTNLARLYIYKKKYNKWLNRKLCPNFSEFFGDMDFRLKLKNCLMASKGESEMISQLRVGMGSWQEHETSLCHGLSIGVHDDSRSTQSAQ